MSWSDILGIIGSIGSAAGDILPGTAGDIAGAVGKIASAVGQGAAAAKSSAQSEQATGATTRAMDMALAIAAEKAKEDKTAYDKLMGLIPAEAKAYTAEEAALGPVQQVDAAAVAARANQLLPQYMQDTDYEIQKAFTSGLAPLYRQGLDTSTFGIQSRATLGDEAAKAHRATYNQAYDDAMKYVTSLSDAQLKTRAAALGEVEEPFKTAIAGYGDIYSRASGGADTALGTALTGASDLSKQAGTGVQSAATGASASDLGSSLKKVWSDIFGNTSGPDNPTAPGADKGGLIPGTLVGGGHAQGY